MHSIHPPRLATRMLIVGLLTIAGLAPAVAHGQIAVLSNVVDERSIDRGTRHSGAIVIANPTDRPQHARLYQTDYHFAANGTSTFADAGSTTRSNAGWITPQSNHVVVAAGAEIVVPYSIVVPAADTLNGTYWSMIMVEAVPSGETHAAKPGTHAVTAVMRYAIQVATHVDEGPRAIRFEHARALRAATGTAELHVDVHADGARAYRPELWVEVYDEQGNVRAKARQTRGLLYPGTSLHQRFELGGALPSGKYTAVFFADTGDDAIVATQIIIAL